ncbi:biotin transporter BioY [Sneathiella glossodoripedis]|uniref:biotin transporter BioY n=1 Tax=Sneathiella glossodoripedis TaxID=418853 RepID=UPI00055C8B4D|nr:biotin transporter BioY [Sneathiella glossodoripedis]
MNTKDVVYIALFAALLAGLGAVPPLTLPNIGVPITAQTMGVMLAGGILGAKRGALSVVLFLVLVAVGLPLLSGGRGGMGVFAGVSAGFLFSWVIGAYIVGLIVEQNWERLNFVWAMAATIVGGIFIVYLIGIPWLAIAAQMPFLKAFTASMAFVPGDIIKAVVSAFVVIQVKKSYPLINR